MDTKKTKSIKITDMKNQKQKSNTQTKIQTQTEKKSSKIKPIDKEEDTKINFDMNIDLDELIPSDEKNNTSNKISNRISETNYIRPPLTYTDKLSKIQVKELLIDYEQIKTLQQLQNIPPGSHLRYFEYKDGELKFRTGGILTVVSGIPEYLILSSGKVSWSVQIKKCIFFKRITIKQVREEFQKKIYEDSATITGLQALLKDANKKIKKISDALSKYENVEEILRK